MPEQISLDLPSQPLPPRLKLVPRLVRDLGLPPEQLCIDFNPPPLVLIGRVPRIPSKDTTCAGSTMVEIDGIQLPAAEWARRLGLKWQTVKMRRMRGSNWAQALASELKRNAVGPRWKLHG